MKSVQVLMSTYNGQKYLREQVDSILAQKGVEVHLLVRDDGSRDDTVKILMEYKNIEVIVGENVGVCKSFFELINAADDYEYYSFADQDDVWDEDKLSVAIDSLEKNKHIPAVYAANTRLVDENLTFLKNENDNPRTTLGSAFIKNYCTGCTMVFNKKLLFYLKGNLPDYAVMHDWWVNLVCLSLGGECIYDIIPHMHYRQHGNNVLGVESNFIIKAKKRWKKFLYTPYHRERMAKELLDKYSVNMDSESKVLVEIIGKNSIGVFDIIRNKNLRTGCWLNDFLFGVMVLFKKT